MRASLQYLLIDRPLNGSPPEWTWTPARDCGVNCPYMINLLDFEAVQWRFTGHFHGLFDLEFIDDKGRMYGNMDL